jgi:flagellar motor switch protein FliM
MLDVEPISLVDLVGQAKTPKLNSVVVDGLADRCMREIRQNLVDLMRSPVQVLSCKSDVSTLASCLSELPRIILGAIVNVAEVNARILMVIDGNLVAAVLDRMCGATAPSATSRSELSKMETRTGKKIIEDSLRTIGDVVGAIAKVKLTLMQYETSTAMLAIGDGRDWMFVCKGVLETGTGSGAITVMCPISAFDNLESLPGFTGSRMLGQHVVDPRWESTLGHLTETVTVELRVEIARAKIPVAVMEGLRPGQILPLVLLPDAIGVVAGIDLFFADYGQSFGFVCCRPKDSDRPGPAGAPTFEKEKMMMTSETDRVEPETLTALPLGGLAVPAKPVERVPVTLSVELGRTSISLKDLRQLRHGQVITLDQMVGEPLSIFANGQRLALGEVVAVGKSQYGVRVLSLIEDQEQFQKEAAE